MAIKYENIENIKERVGTKTDALSKKIAQAEKRATEIIKKLDAMAAKKREEQRIAEEKAQLKAEQEKQEALSKAEQSEQVTPAQVKVEQPQPAQSKNEMSEQVAPAQAKTEQTQSVQPKAEQPQPVLKNEGENAKTADKDSANTAQTSKTNAEQATVKASTAQTPAKKAETVGAVSGTSEQTESVTPVREEASAQPKSEAKPFKPQQAKVGQTEQPVRTANTQRKPFDGQRPQNTQSQPARVQGQGQNQTRPQRGERRPAQQTEGRTFINKDNRPQGQGARPPKSGNASATPVRTPRPQNGAMGARPQGGKFNVAPSATAAQQKPAKKKQPFEKTYVEKERHPVSKRTLVKQQGATVSDFDEDKSGYRKLRVKKDKKAQKIQTVKIESAVVTTNDIAIKVLSEKLGITAVQITKILFKEGIMKTVNETIDYDTASLVAAELGIELEYKPEKTAEELLSESVADTVEEIEQLVPRAPVVTVMGHVDHGKTSLLDYIRKTKVTASEAGGITQHIGAYSVSVSGRSITFLDTPGHEAFTAMRARGAQVTDIVILVIAADDGIKPQTVEAINHAKAAGVSIIVACNKMDKPDANPSKVMQDLTNYGLLPEEWGGEVPVIPISCKTGMGIDELLENVLLVAEMKELLANPEREARGTIIEALLDKGKGPLASVLIQNGTLRTGDNIISGTITGRVRAMIDDKGRTIKEAGPSQAVFVLGFEEVPNAGDQIFAVSQELMKQVTEERKRKESDARVAAMSKISLDDVFGKIAEGNIKTLNLIIKGDVQGSVEAVKQSVVKLSNEELQVKVIHSGAGAITETDVMLADSSNAIILGFNVRPDSKAKVLAERSKVDVRMYRIIYDLLDDVEKALKGMLTPKYQEVYLGKCEVRQTFKITGVGTVAGCYVLEGKIIRGGKLRIYRDDILIVEGNVQQLKRFKDDVKEVNYGYECGCAIEGFNDIKVGDVIECYVMEEIKVK